MKLSLATVAICAVTIPSAMSAYNVQYGKYGRPNIVSFNVNRDAPGCGSDLSSVRRGRRRRISRRPTGDMIDQQFESFKNEIKQQEAARREVIRQQQEFVNRAFGLANEVVQKVADQSGPDDTKEVPTNKLVNRFFGFSPDEVMNNSLRSKVHVDDEKFQFTLDVPGVEASNIEISLEDNKLVITGERTYGDDDVRKFSRSWQLVSAPFDASNIEANLNNGVLTVTVPKDLDKIRDRVKNIAVMTEDAMIKDVSESDDGEMFEVMLDMPGVEAADVSVSVEDKTTLRVEGERKFDDSNSRKFSRSWKLGSTAYDVENGRAVLKNGVLKVQLLKEKSSNEKEGSLKIAIQEGARVTTEKVEVDEGTESPEKTDEIVDTTPPSEDDKDEDKYGNEYPLN